MFACFEKLFVFTFLVGSIISSSWKFFIWELKLRGCTIVYHTPLRFHFINLLGTRQ